MLCVTHNATIEWVPASHLRASLQNIGQFQWYNAQNRVMLPVTLVTDGDCNDRRPPIPHKSLGPSIKDWLAADNFGSSTIYLT